MKNPLEKDFERISLEITELENNTLKRIKTDEEALVASGLLVSIKEKYTQAETLRKFFTQPLVEQKRNIDSMFRERVFRLEELSRVIRKQLGEYQMKKQEEAEKKEAKNIAKIHRDNAKRIERGEAMNLIPTAMSDGVSNSITTEKGTTTFVEKWKFELEDINKVPDALVTRELNRAEVQKLVSSGVREINGIRIYKDIETRVTTK